MGGWIKLYRSFRTSPNALALSNNDQRMVMLEMLLAAAYEPTPWSCKRCGATWTLQPGQFSVGLKVLAGRANCGIQSVRTAIARLEQSGFLSNTQVTRCHRVYTVRNYTRFQGVKTQPNTEVTSSQHEANMKVTPSKKPKSLKSPKTVVASDPAIRLATRWAAYQRSEGIPCSVKTDIDLAAWGLHLDKLIADTSQPRASAIVDWLTSPDGEFFARNVVRSPAKLRKRDKNGILWWEDIESRARQSEPAQRSEHW